jgi:hypothetical protein
VFDYKKWLKGLETEGAEDIYIEVGQSEKRVDVYGNKKSLLYLACSMIEFFAEECDDGDFAELNFDRGVDLTSESSSLCLFLAREEEKQ